MDYPLIVRFHRNSEVLIYETVDQGSKAVIRAPEYGLFNRYYKLKRYV